MFYKSYEDRLKKTASERASREWERIKLERKWENDRKIKKLHEKFGDNIPKAQIDPVMQERMEILYNLNGNSQGLRDKGEVPDAEAAIAPDELNAVREGKL